MLDTNVLVYNWAGTTEADVAFRRNRVRDLLGAGSTGLAICGLVLYEAAGVLGKVGFELEYPEPAPDESSIEARRRASEAAIMEVLELTERRLDLVEHASYQDVKAGTRLHADHGFQPKDGIIIAAALRSSCKVLLSEDMQDGRIVSDSKGFGGGRSVQIVNPFFDKS